MGTALERASPCGDPAIRPRPAARGRPLEDAGCAGCAHLGTLWALRRAGIEPVGAMGCEGAPSGGVAPGRFAAVAGARALLREGAPSLLGRAAEKGARFVVVADRPGAPGASSAAAALQAAGAHVRTLDPARLEDARDAVAWAISAGPGAALVALTPCVRGAERAAPLSILPSRCNRCGACLGLGCVAISDPGGESLAIDASACTGCGACAPLCRSRAIAVR
jgi:hypothetical protein